MPPTLSATAGAVVVSAPLAADSMPEQIGREHYSYSFAVERFRPLLDRWGPYQEVARAESRADFSLRRFRQQGLSPFHLSFAPLHAVYLARTASNAAFVFWEFPDIPTSDIENNPRLNWTRTASKLDRILTASTFARDAFRKAGVTTPIDVVPVPVLPSAFDVPDWQPGRAVSLPIRCYRFPQPNALPIPHNPWTDGAAADAGPSLQTRLRAFYRATVRPYLPESVMRGVQLGSRRVLRLLRQSDEEMQIPLVPSPTLDLSGVVYLHLANPHDGRKNWQDLLTAFLRALGDREDATLVLKLIVPADLIPHAVRRVATFYRELGIPHRCQFVLIADYLSDAQLLDLVGASTYSASATRAEGANLPLLESLAAGRPALSPRHTSTIDYFDDDLGWVVPSQPEPTAFPFGGGSAATTWHRIDWQALSDLLRESYEVARTGHDRYRRFARQARQRMSEYASLEAIWPRFAAALDALAGSEDRPGTRFGVSA